MPNKCEIDLKDGSPIKNNLKRNNYFTGKSLSAEDFTAEQNYVIEKIRRLSAKSNGFGVIEGLKIESVKTNQVILNPGAGIDANGNLLLLSNKKTFDLEKTIKAGDYIYIKYIERGNEPISVVDTEVCDDECCYNKIEEAFEVVISHTLNTFPVPNICSRNNTKKAGKSIFENKVDSLLLIGQYNSQGGVDYSEVNTLYKNSELSKLLCEISQKYVSSINGETGNVSAVSSINNAKPDEEGHINFVTGNNISIESTGHNVTISSKNGYYHEYYLTIKGTATSTKAEKFSIIKHYAKRFPVVDIYKRERDTSSGYRAIKDTELKQSARDTNKTFDQIKKDTGAIRYQEHVLKSNEDAETNYIHDGQEKEAPVSLGYVPSDKQKEGEMYSSYLFDGREPVSTALSNVGVHELSPQVVKLSDAKISEVIDHIYIAPKYIYTKVVGTEDENINIEVTHLNRNSLKLENRSVNDISILVVLTT